jgi:hypothetical protein
LLWYNYLCAFLSLVIKLYFSLFEFRFIFLWNFCILNFLSLKHFFLFHFCFYVSVDAFFINANIIFCLLL